MVGGLAGRWPRLGEHQAAHAADAQASVIDGQGPVVAQTVQLGQLPLQIGQTRSRRDLLAQHAQPMTQYVALARRRQPPPCGQPPARPPCPHTNQIAGTAPAKWRPDDCEWYARWENGREGHAVLGVYTRGGTVFTSGLCHTLRSGQAGFVVSFTPVISG